MNLNVKTTVCEMIQDRNNKFSLQQLNENIMIASSNNSTILIYSCHEKKSGVKTIFKLQSLTNEYNANHIIFIYKHSITIFAKNAIKEFSETHNIIVEIFCVSELMFNVTKHKLVPQHEILSETDKKEIMLKLRCNDIKKFPHILTTDPVAKYFNMKRGQLVRISRPSETVGKCVSYRIVM